LLVRAEVGTKVRTEDVVQMPVPATAAPSAPDRVFLNLENVRGLNDATAFNVYINVPVGAAALVLAWLFVPDSTTERPAVRRVEVGVRLHLHAAGADVELRDALTAANACCAVDKA